MIGETRAWEMEAKRLGKGWHISILSETEITGFNEVSVSSRNIA